MRLAVSYNSDSDETSISITTSEYNRPNLIKVPGEAIVSFDKNYDGVNEDNLEIHFINPMNFSVM